MDGAHHLTRVRRPGVVVHHDRGDRADPRHRQAPCVGHLAGRALGLRPRDLQPQLAGRGRDCWRPSGSGSPRRSCRSSPSSSWSCTPGCRCRSASCSTATAHACCCSCGLALMTRGQLAFAFATTFRLAVLARVLIGAGDAAMFVSVIRLVTLWFLVRQAPMITQLTGQLGQVGAIAAAAPLSLALRHLGWTKVVRAGVDARGDRAWSRSPCWSRTRRTPRERVAEIKMRALARSSAAGLGQPRHAAGDVVALHRRSSARPSSRCCGAIRSWCAARGCRPDTASALLMVMTRLDHRHRARSWARWSPATRSTARGWCSGIVAAMALGWAVVLARSTPGAGVDAGRPGLPDGDRWPGLDGRLRPRPHLHPGRGVGPGQRLRQHRRLLRQPAHDGADRRAARLAQRWRWLERLRPGRLPGRDVGAVRCSGCSVPCRSCATGARRSPTSSACTPVRSTR